MPDGAAVFEPKRDGPLGGLPAGVVEGNSEVLLGCGVLAPLAFSDAGFEPKFWNKPEPEVAVLLVPEPPPRTLLACLFS